MRILRRLLKMYTGIRHGILLFVTEYFAMYSTTRVMCRKSSAIGLMKLLFAICAVLFFLSKLCPACATSTRRGVFRGDPNAYRYGGV